MNRRHALATLLACAAILSAAAADPWPTKTVTLVVPYSPGGLPDTVARFVGQKLSEKWGQPVVIENKPGSNGVVAYTSLATRPADGYTLVVTDNSMYNINPYIYKDLPYDAERDFTHLSLIARAPLFLAVNPDFPAKDFGDFVKLVKASPGKYSYGSSGVGSIMHLCFETMKSTLGLDIVHVPYKGTGQAIPALVGNQVVAVWSAMPSIAGFAKEGKVRLIAVNSSKRSDLAPQVATIAETHIPGFDFAPIIGISGVAGIPPAVVQKVGADVAEALKDPVLVEKLASLGIEPVGGDGRAYATQIANDRERFQRAAKLSGANAN